MKKSDMVLKAIINGCEDFVSILAAVGLTRRETRNAIGNLKARQKISYVKENGRSRYTVRLWAKELK